MKNVFNKTTILLAVIAVMLICPAELFAGGNKEEGVDTGFEDIIEVTDENIASLECSTAQAGGITGVYIHPKIWKADFGLARVTVAGVTSYYSVNEDMNKLIGTQWSNYFSNTAAPAVVALTEESAKKFPEIVSLHASSGSTSDISAIKALSNSTDNNPLKLCSGGSAKLKVEYFAQDIEYDCILYNQSKNEYVRFRSVIRPEFFKGEYDIFENAALSGFSYEHKAVAMLGRVIKNLSSVYGSLNTGFGTPDWDMFNSIDTVLMTKAEGDLRRKISLHIETLKDAEWEKGYPVMDTEAMFEGIYGVSSNVYLKTFLEYIYHYGKPALSSIYADLYERESRSYDYKNYEPLTANEGIELARNAMRYYTWGVEYTAFSGYNISVKAEGMNRVWQEYGSNAYITNWAKGTSNGLKENNYADDVSSFILKPSNVTTITSNSVSKLTVKAEAEDAVIHKIDMWSARNIAWDNTIKSTLLYQADIGSSVPLNISVIDKGLTEVTTLNNVLNNAELVLGSSEAGSIKLDKVDEHGIGFGYEFEKLQTVQSVMLVKGYSTANSSISYPKMDDGIEKFAVYYGSGTQWYKLQPREYIECVTDNKLNNYTFYPETQNRKPGYGIWNNYFSKNESGTLNSELVTSYIIFNSPVECDKILVVDQSGNVSLTLTELGVFDADPLQHLDYEKVDAVNEEKEISWNSDEITGVDVSGTTLENVMINGSPALASGYTLTGGSGYIYIQTKTEAPLCHLLSWYSVDGSTMKLQNNVTAYAGDISIQDNEYFVPLVNLGQDETWSGVKNVVDTPFYKKLAAKYSPMLGNPLPYAPDGIDSPRTFAYKMVKQKEARDSIKEVITTTEAIDQSYEQGYARKEEFTSLGTNKPFLPGYYLPYGKTTYNTSFKPEMSAGVDDMGLLQGAMSMMDGVEFYNLEENSLGTNLDAYYSMSSAAPGLGADNKPVFDATEAQSYDNILKMSMADIERGSIIVPDISDIQPGDLLVRNTDSGHHVGVVVGFRDTKPTAATAASDWWENVLVVSVRPGFQSVTLGTWGNQNSIFGGFTENPEEYLVRRLVKHADVPMTAAIADKAECINSIYHQFYEDYTTVKGKTPFYAHKIDDSTIMTGENRYNKFLLSTLRYFREQPPTSYFQNRTPTPVFDLRADDEPVMCPTNYTGWRELENTDYIKYHRGIDAIPTADYTHVADGGQTTVPIRAPEAGKYWVLNLGEGDGDELAGEFYIQIDNDNFLILERYNEAEFGDIGVLVTNPADPIKGRIYLFAHLYFEKRTDGTDGMKDYYTSNAIVHFNDINGNEITTLPKSWDEGGYVEAGGWIGLMAGNPKYPAHAHMEVYEFFRKYEHGDTVENNNIDEPELTYDKIKGKIFSSIGAEPDLETVKKCIGWQRVDPRTVFQKGLIDKITEGPDGNDEVKRFIAKLLSDDTYWTDVLQKPGETQEDKIEELFEEWTRWTETTREESDE